jgi:four helix bundle protein
MQKELIDKNPVLKQSIHFSLAIIEYCDELNSIKKYSISNQLLRSGTSIGANAMEAQNAESKADFIHKMKIAAKEADETQYWLALCDYAPNLPGINELDQKLIEIQKIINAIIGSAKKKNPFSYILSFFIF